MQEHERGAVMGALSKGKKGGKSKVASIHVRRAASGGFIARHEMEQGKGEDAGTGGAAEEHIMPDMPSLQAHMASAMGDQPAAMPPPGNGQPQPDPGAGD